MMDDRSETAMVGLHPDLIEVLRAAPQAPQPFIVILGLRTPQMEAKLVAAHKSQTAHSRHLPNSQGFGCAADVMALIDGHGSFAPGHEERVFGQICDQILSAAGKLHIPIQWGGAKVGAWTPGRVSNFRDWDHFQLPWKEYP